MITSEELKVGETYVVCEQPCTVLFIGKTRVFYNCVNDKSKESSLSIDYCLKSWSLTPKPKKKLELVKFLHVNGFTREALIGSDDFVDIICKTEGYTRISSRTIEVEDDR